MIGFRWGNITYDQDGHAHVRVTDSDLGEVTVVMLAGLVGTDAGSLIIDRVLANRREQRDQVHGEGS